MTTLLSHAPTMETPALEPAASSEFVIGPRQLAGIAFVVIAALALFSAVSYLAGKAEVTHAAPLPAIQVKLPVPEPPTPSIGDQFAAYAATVPPKAIEAPIFAEPTGGSRYIQMAAVEKSVAAVFAEGLRTHGLTAFVAPGPSASVYRVLIGPVQDAEKFKLAKQELDKMGLSTFARQYEK